MHRARARACPVDRPGDVDHVILAELQPARVDPPVDLVRTSGADDRAGHARPGDRPGDCDGGYRRATPLRDRAQGVAERDVLRPRRLEEVRRTPPTVSRKLALPVCGSWDAALHLIDGTAAVPPADGWITAERASWTSRASGARAWTTAPRCALRTAGRPAAPPLRCQLPAVGSTTWPTKRINPVGTSRRANRKGRSTRKSTDCRTPAAAIATAVAADASVPFSSTSIVAW